MPLRERDSSVQIYHPVFSSDNYESIVALEFAMQVVYDHAKSQLPESIAKRVLERCRFCGHGDTNGATRPATAGFIYTAFHTATQEIRQPPRASGSEAKHARRS